MNGLDLTRRHFLRDCGVGLGKIALTSLMADALGGRARAERLDEVVGQVDIRRRVDHRNVEDLEARHGQALFGFVRRLGLSDEQAADSVQEVLLRLWAEIDKGVVIHDPKAWVFRSIYRLAMDEHRLRRRVSGLVALIGGRSARQEPEHDVADRIAVWTEVDRLPERQRHVLYLRYRADLPFDQIGDVLGMTASAARSHATQATATLRRRLGAGDTDGAAS